MSSKRKSSTPAGTAGAFEAAFEAQPQPLCILDCESQRLLAVNAAAAALYGGAREQLLGATLLDLRRAGDDAQGIAAAVEALCAVQPGDKPLVRELRLARADGSPLEIEAIAYPADYGGRSARLLVLRELGGQRGSEGGRYQARLANAKAVVLSARAALHPVEQRLRGMLEQSPLAVLVLDRGGTVEYANPFFLALTGRPWEEVVGRRAFGAFLEGPGGGPKRAHFQSELFTLAGVRHMSWTQSALGDERGAAEAFLYIGTDMTEHWHAERALRRSEQRFRALIEGSPDAVALCTQGKLTYANPALAALLGRSSSAELLGKDLLDLVHEADRDAVRERVASVAPKPRGEPLLEVRFLREGGEVAFAEIASLPVEADGGAGVILVARDTAERRQMQARLVQASRLASVGTLAAGVAHEVNNPLAYVDANLTFVRSVWAGAVEELRARRRGDAPPPRAAGQPSLDESGLAEVASALEESAVGIERVRHIVSGLKEFARSEAEQLRRLDLREVVESSLKMISHELQHRARVVRDLRPAPEVLGNDSRLSQVFINLLLNAMQSLPPHSSVDSAEVRVRTFADSRGRAVVAIEDTGTGIAADELPHIFDPFFTTRPVGKGPGLGLSIAHGIVSGMGGEIEVESVRGAGSVFRVVLPAAGKA